MSSPHKIEAQQEQQQTPAAKLEESIRELIRQEMGHPPPLKPTPSRGEAGWLFLCIANAALILLLLPDALLKNDKWETLGKLIAWLSGSLFVLGSVWFREFFLALSRRRAFKVTQVVLLFILVPVYISQMPVFSIRPKIEPADIAELEVDGMVVSGEARKELRLPLNQHTFVIKRKPGVDRELDPEVDPNNDPNKDWKERTFKIGRLNLLRMWWRDEQPYWPLYFPITFYAEKPLSEVVVQRNDNQFDPELLDHPPPLQVTNPQQEAGLRKDIQNGNPVLLYRWPFKDKAGYVIQWLPAGKYNLSTRASNCDKPVSQEFEVQTKIAERTELEIPCAMSK